MLSYMDRAFCIRTECKNNECYRKLKPEHQVKAEAAHLPVSFSDFKDTDECEGYQ